MRLATAFILSLVCVLISFGGDDPADVAPPADVQPDRLVIYTVNHPLAYFAERIGGESCSTARATPSGSNVRPCRPRDWWTPRPDFPID